MYKIFSVILLLTLLTASHAWSSESTEKGYEYYEIAPLEGQGAIELLNHYQLSAHNVNFHKFYEINDLSPSDYLLQGKSYKLPILVYSYNGKSIRSTIGINDYNQAVRIQDYNILLHRKNIKKEDYRKDKVLFVPYHEIAEKEEIKVSESKTEEGKMIVDLFGEKYKSFDIKSQTLKNKVYYIVAGHGGPDPGAIGKSNGHILYEDEYAYDISLRLSRLLMQHGATVHNIIQDKNDGIRDDKILPVDRDEVTIHGDPIPLNQVQRLNQRASIINDLYWVNRRKGLTDQVVVVLHVDSRHKDHRQDVFFLHHEKSTSGKKLASNLLDTFTQKYKKYRASGEYDGVVKTRNLYMLRETLPPTIFIELANIQNTEDQKRIILKSNREALAEWLFEGLIKK